jgi:TDG/mug DNA glycosylase family protein
MTHHRIELDWMGQKVTTLSDLWPQDLRAVVVGINPAPRSVEIGHYYQGNLGQVLFRRLRNLGVLGHPAEGFEDDQALSIGIGFTDVVKRPTSNAAEVRPEELAFGKSILGAELAARQAPLVIFAFKQAAETMLGKFRGNGFISTSALGDTRAFVMPGPYESAATANATLKDLQIYWGRS